MDTIRPLPRELERLGPLAFDLRLAGSKTMARVWRRLDPEAWDRTNNPYIVLLHARRERLEEAASDPALLAELDRWFERRAAIEASAGWFGRQEGSSTLTGCAYFSMEFGLSEALPIYSGGLGMLAGDHLKSANDQGVPVIGIGLLYQQGYFRQVLAPDGSQLEAFPFNDPGSLPVQPVLDADGRWPRVRLELPGRTLLLRVWQARIGRVCLYLLDSNHPLNSPWDRGITADLYASGREKRLLQELVLGVGGYRLLGKLGIDAQVCHLNEGHAAFAVVARASAFAGEHGVPFHTGLRATRAGNVFTTHTPVEAAFDRFEPDLVLTYAAPLIEEAGLEPEAFLALGRRNAADASEPFNMAWLAMHGSQFVNGVARLHGAVSRQLFAGLFPGRPVSEVPVGHVTNGIHVPTWHSEEAARLWSQAYGERRAWLGDLDGAAARIAKIPDERVWVHRSHARAALVDYVRDRRSRQVRVRGEGPDAVARAGRLLDPNVLTVGFARRFASYKRPWLLLRDPDRLVRLLRDPERPIQLLVAGKAHPDDTGAKGMVRDFARFAWREDVRDRVVFLEDYDMVVAQHLVAGVDVWINNPRRPYEACGTSGMKVLVNGGLNASTLDGWWDEAFEPDLGWAIGDRDDHDGARDDADAAALYELLEQHIAPEFYERDELGIPRRWVERIRASMARLTPAFSSDRMIREYVLAAYLPAAHALADRVADGGRLAAELEAWSTSLRDGWDSIRFGRLTAEPVADGWTVHLEVFLGDVPATGVRVEAYAEDGGDPGTGAGSIAIPMPLEREIVGAVNGHVFTARLPGTRPLDHYTPRIVPWHPAAVIPLEIPLIAWGPRSAEITAPAPDAPRGFLIETGAADEAMPAPPAESPAEHVAG
jgi:glycogen phosphorylase